MKIYEFNLVGLEQEQADNAARALLSRKCVYRIRIVEVHDLTIKQRRAMGATAS